MEYKVERRRPGDNDIGARDRHVQASGGRHELQNLRRGQGAVIDSDVVDRAVKHGIGAPVRPVSADPNRECVVSKSPRDGHRASGSSVNVESHRLAAPCHCHMVPVGVGDTAGRDRLLRTLVVGIEMEHVVAACKKEIVVPCATAIGLGCDAAIIAQCAPLDPGGDGDVARDPEAGAIGDLDVVVHAIETQGIANLARD